MKKLYCKRLSRLPILFFICLISPFVSAQHTNISGIVSDDMGAIPGVTVQVDGKSGGAVTNLDGKYIISAQKGEMLVFSFVGMETQKVKVTGAVHNVTLASSSIGLEEVVAIGYGTVKKKELTGAVAQVKGEELTRIVTSDLGQALQGMVAGVNVTANSGQPGESANILIRGVSSLDGNNTPLYVVDGVPQEDDPRLSTNEIETIDILKDAASAAIYGTRGAAGVILITTKQGKTGSKRISANASYGVQDIRSGVSLMNSEEQIYADMLSNRAQNGTADDMMSLNMLKNKYRFFNDTDLGELIFKDYAPVQDYNVNFSGGTKDFTYSVMVGYHNKDGIVINSDFERINARANTPYTHEKWRINASIGMTHETTNRSPSGIITQSVKYHPSMPSLDLESDDPIYAEDANQEAGNSSWVLETFKNTDENKRNTSYGNLNINYQLLRGLSLSTRVGIRALNDYRHRFSPYQEIYKTDGTLYGTPQNTSYVTMDASRSYSTTWDVGATYNTIFQKKHKLTLYAGQSLEQYTYSSFQAKKTWVSDNDVQVLDGALSNPSATSLGNDYVNRLIGSIGRVQYSYKGRYMLSASVRCDASSKFAEANRWGVFPSASGAWNVSDESFYSPIKGVMNTFKVRMSYGTVGNQNFKAYQYTPTIEQGIDYIFGGDLANGSARTSFPNSTVKWETSKQANFGVDLAFLKNKITFTAEYYNTNKNDMLMPIQLPSSTGSIPNLSMYNYKSSIVYLNVGDMINKGYEFAASFKQKTGKINWTFTGTFSTNENVITKINGLGGFTLLDDSGLISGKQAQSQVTAIAEGHEAGAFYLYKTDGVVNTTEELLEYQQVRPDAQMGDLIYIDQDGDNEITEADRRYCGSGLPEYEVGFNTKASYKGFDFSMQWYSAIGHEIMNGAKATAYGWGRHKDLVSQWSEANPTSDIPVYRGDPSEHPNYTGYTDLWLEDGTYLRLKQITLGYSLSKKVLKNMNLSKCRFYLTAQNPLTFTRYEGFDPEVGGNVSTRGLDKGNYPVTSLYTVGVNLNF